MEAIAKVDFNVFNKGDIKEVVEQIKAVLRK